MEKSLPAFIGLRYVRSKQSEGFFSIVSGFSFGAMTLGVIALIVVLSVMNGFDHEIKSRILNIVPHLSLRDPQPESSWQRRAEELRENPQIVAVTPFVEGQAMLSTGTGLQGVSIQGVNPEAEGVVAVLEEHMLAGSARRLEQGKYGVVLGSLLARSLDVITGDEVLITLPDLIVTPVGIFPRTKRLRVVGIYRVGAQVDTGIAFLHLGDLQTLLRLPGQVHGLRLNVRDPFSIDTLTRTLQAQMPEGTEISSWQQSLNGLFQAIKMEKTVVGVLLAVIIAVAAFNIVASLVLMVADKRKDIAVLRAMGATGRDINAIFRIQGAAVGIGGVVLGVVLGCLLAWQLGSIVAFLEAVTGVRVFDPEVYFISEIPSRVQWPDVVIVAALGAGISFISTLYPAYRASQVNPAEILRYDH